MVDHKTTRRQRPTSFFFIKFCASCGWEFLLCVVTSRHCCSRCSVLDHSIPMSLKVTGVYFSASSAGPGTGKMKATIRAARQHNNHHQQQQQQQSLISSPPNRMTNHDPSPNGRLILGPGNQSHLHSQSQSLDYLHNRHQQQHHPLNFEEKRQIIASSLSLVDFLHRQPVKVKGNTKTDTKNIDTSRTQKRTN